MQHCCVSNNSDQLVPHIFFSISEASIIHHLRISQKWGKCVLIGIILLPPATGLDLALLLHTPQEVTNRKLCTPIILSLAAQFTDLPVTHFQPQAGGKKVNRSQLERGIQTTTKL